MLASRDVAVYILIELHAYDVAGNCTVLFLLQPTQEVHNV